MDSGSETTLQVSSGSSSLEDEESGRSSRGHSFSSVEELDSAGSGKNISYSPFSLSINRKVSMSKVEGVSNVGSSIPSSAAAQLKDIASPSLTASLLKDPNMSPKKQVQELQRELTNLKKEMDSKDAKLSSSMRSIKMFWSPELKKERALRKEEAEKFVAAREQVKKMKEECQKRSKKVKDLEAQLETEQRLNRDHLLSEQQIAEQRKTEAAELERVKEEKGKYQDENVLLQKLVSELEENVKNLAEGLERSKCTLDSVVLEKAEAVRDKESVAKALESAKEEIGNLRTTLQRKEEEDSTLRKSIEQLKAQEMKLRNSLDTKTTEISDLKKQITLFKDEATELKREKDRRLKQQMVEEDSQEMLRNEVMALQMRLDSFETNAAVKDAEIVSLQSVIDSLQSKSGAQVDKVKQLETALSAQNVEVKNLEDEVCSLTSALGEKENLVRQKEDHLASLTLSSNRRDTELEQLREAIEKKTDETKRLDAKYEKLDNYVCEREKALAQSREEVNHLRSAHANCSTTISVLEGQLREKEDFLAQLTLDYEKMEREIGELGNLPKRDSQQAKESESAPSHSGGEDIIRQLETKANELTMKLEEQESNIENLNRVLETKDRTIEDLTKEIRKAQDAISKLEDEVNSKNNKIKDLQGENTVTKDDNKENVRPSSQGPQSRTSKQLLEDIANKDARITDLEKQLKDKSKLLSVRRRSETTERGKEAQQFSEQLKQNDEVKAKLTELQDELEKKDDRIMVLEDALRESVSIAAEREDLLAQHVEMSEKAARKIQELESEVDRATMEKAITNIKNAFLILSVSEKDSVLAMFKANRRKNLEELLNMKQRALEACISEKDINIAYLEQITSSKTKKQEAKILMQEKARLLGELKEQTQIRMTLLNNEENKEGSLAKELSDGTRDQILEALRQVTDSSDKLEFYIEDLLTFIKEKNLELLKEMPTLPQRNGKAIDRLKNCGKNELLKELERLGHESSQLKGYVDSILDKLEG